MSDKERQYGTPAIVLGHGLTVLGTIRGLGRRCIPCFCHGPLQPLVSRSRYFQPLQGHNLPSEESRLAEILSSCSLESAVLIACTDRWVQAVARLPRELADRFPWSGPSLATAELFVDKLRFHELLVREQIPMPLTVPLASDADLEKVDLSKVEGGFLKPIDSQGFGTHFKKKAFTFTGAAEARQKLGEAMSAGFAMILQEYIPGPPTEHYFLDGFVDRHGTIAAWFGRRRLRMFPSDFGNSTYLEATSLEQLKKAKSSLERILKAVQYRGIFSAEFKRDPRDGQYKILEVNARPWWYIGFAIESGVNVAEMAYRDALGLPIATGTTYRPGRRFVFPPYDTLACRELHKTGALSRWQWIRQWAGATQAVLVWYDPRPSLDGWGIRLKRSFKRRVLGQSQSAL